MPVQRVVRVIATVLAVAVVLGTGVAWSNVRSFEDGIFHMFAPSLGQGGDDGAIDILLVGMDSRTDAHGNPLSPEELATLRAGDEEATNTDTIILVRIPNNGKSATAISIPRDSYVAAPGLGKTKINGVYGADPGDQAGQPGRSRRRAAEAEAQGTEAGREALIKTVADLTGVTVDHYAEIGLLGFSLITDALGGVNVCLKEPVFEPLSGADFPGRPAEAQRPASAELRPAAPRAAPRRPGPGGAPAGGDGLAGPPGDLRQDAVQPATMNRLQQAIQRSVVLSSGWDIMDFVKQLQKLAGGKVAFATIPVLDESGWSDDGMQSVVRVDPHQVQDWVGGLLQDQAKGKTEQLAYTPAKTTASVVNDTDINGLAASVSEVLTTKGFSRRRGRQQRRGPRDGQPGAGRQGRRPGRASGRQRAGRAARRRRASYRRDRFGWCWPMTTPARARAWATGPPRRRPARRTPARSNDAPPPSPILTAGSDHPECVN